MTNLRYVVPHPDRLDIESIKKLVDNINTALQNVAKVVNTSGVTK